MSTYEGQAKITHVSAEPVDVTMMQEKRHQWVPGVMTVQAKGDGVQFTVDVTEAKYRIGDVLRFCIVDEDEVTR